METDFIKDNSIINFTLVDQQKAIECGVVTSKQTVLENVNYNELVKLLGNPTFSIQSLDEKVQVEWVMRINGHTVTIYDYKTYDREYTINKLTVWSVGGDDWETCDELVNMIHENLNKEEEIS